MLEWDLETWPYLMILFFLMGFNDSLLAKQAWCLLHNKFSFLQGVQSPVFSKYYYHGIC